MTKPHSPKPTSGNHDSATESELKFTLPRSEVPTLIAFLNRHFTPQPTLQLSNAYFDTAAGDLNQLRIGCRIRRWQLDGQDHAEQTVKLAGQVVNGLHQRPEYNLPQGKQEMPDLTRFPLQIWPESLDVSSVNSALRCIFNVTFERQCWHLEWVSNNQAMKVEVVLDQGFIVSGDKKEAILEVEIERQKGALDGLYEVAKMLSSCCNLAEFNKSKAERGFALANS